MSHGPAVDPTATSSSSIDAAARIDAAASMFLFTLPFLAMKSNCRSNFS